MLCVCADFCALRHFFMLGGIDALVQAGPRSAVRLSESRFAVCSNLTGMRMVLDVADMLIPPHTEPLTRRDARFGSSTICWHLTDDGDNLDERESLITLLTEA